MNLADVLKAGAEINPEARAIHHGARHFSYRHLHASVESIARHLLSHGAGPGKIVGLDSHNPVTHWLILLALMRIGAVPVSLSPRFDEETAAIPELALVVTDPDLERSYDAGLKQVRIQTSWVREQPRPSIELPAPEEAAASLGRVSFTSGTTGRPKAVLLDSQRLHARVAGTAGRSGIGASSVLWCGLGPDSSFGFVATLATWLAGGSIVFSRGGKGAFRYLSEIGVNQILASPAALNALLRDAMAGDLPRLRASAMVGGGRLTTGMRNRLLNRVCSEVLVSFGCSEAGGLASGGSEGLDGDGGYVGRIAPDVDVRILSDAGREQKSGEPGHLWIRSPSTAQAYMNDPVADREHFRDGWFRTGDLARVTGGRDLVILGRSVETFNLGGEKVPGADIDAIASEFTTIEDACTVPLRSDDPEAQLAMVIVSSAPELETEAGALAARIRARLPTIPPFLLVSALAIERSAMGKANRAALGARVSDAVAGAEAEFTILGRY